MSNEAKEIARELRTQVVILGGLITLMWFLEIVDQLTGRSLDRLGIIPRTTIGLRGILFAPLLHGSFTHLLANTIPFLTLGWFVMLRRTSDFWVVSAIAMVIGGLGTWLIGAPFTVHIGASGVIFGYLGFLLFRGYFERSFIAILLSVIVVVLYGGLIWGVLPGRIGVSWEGHLFGFIGGAIAARLLAERKPSEPTTI
ncbi:rhomboid family intramembrane serine protease [Oscillatoria sp. FACHB-1407]|uniref:rhomboid family intramembrane serine protease n=1 Tax=Oscillatoria sp. FACHB-1407 TaxID=2692847 RepID=UPI0016896666|nr:rhomboid family intramembrane serine protease [Oscillatoria sp. FACHB-1407]MBD2460595.1 rhomboid family intramembrane serine protease [Oscillatoria sp. FACHB-1407]